MRKINYFGSGSLKQLDTVESVLNLLAERALYIAGSIGKDFSVIEGHRSPERQLKLYEDGKTQLTGGGKHNFFPSKALDFVPYHSIEKTLTGNPAQIQSLASKYGKSFETMNALIMAEFHVIAMCFIQAASEFDVEITWGGDWNRDGSSFDTNFMDWGHIELT